MSNIEEFWLGKGISKEAARIMKATKEHLDSDQGTRVEQLPLLEQAKREIGNA